MKYHKSVMKNGTSRILFALLLLMASQILMAKPDPMPFLIQYGMSDGLKDNYVTDIKQDSLGYIWIGTRNGINRFDGYSFHSYDGLVGNAYTRQILVDRDGQVYVAIGEGLFRYEKEEDSFVQFHLNKDVQGRPQSFKVDRNNKLWLLDNKGRICMLDSMAMTKSYSPEDDLGYTDFCFDEENRIWASDYQGNISCIEFTTDEIRSYRLFSIGERVISKKLYKLVFSEDYSKLYVAYEKDDIKVFDVKSKTFMDLDVQKSLQSPLLINTMAEISENELWIASNKGVVVFNTESRDVSQIDYNALSSISLQSSDIKQLLKDREGGVWMCSYRNGISYYSQKDINTILPLDNQGKILASAITDIKEDEGGNLWVATEDGGLLKQNAGSDAFAKVGFPTYSGIRSVEVCHGRLWIFYFINGVESFELNGSAPKSYNLSSTEGLNYHIYTSKVLSDGTLLVSTDHGLFRYAANNDCFVQVSNKVPKTSYFTIVEDTVFNKLRSAGYCLGLARDENNSYTFMGESVDDIDPEDFVVDMSCDNHGNAWYLLSSSGIIRYDVKSKMKMSQIETSSLPISKITRIIADESSHVWCGTYGGLLGIDVVDGSMRLYVEAQGLLSRQFSNYAGYKTSDGNILMGTAKGIVLIDRHTSSVRPQEEKVVITSIQYAGMDVYPSGVKNSLLADGTEHISLRYNENNFDVTLSTLSYRNIGAVKYVYRLNDRDWTEVRGNLLTFVDLSPGDYLLQIKTIDLLGHELESSPTLLSIEILPPFWQSKLAFIIYAFVLCGIVLCLAHFNIRKQKRKILRQQKIFEMEKEQEIYRSKIDFFYDVAHELRTPVTLISVPLKRMLKYSKVCERGRRSLQIMDRNTDRVLLLLNRLLEFRSVEKKGGNPLSFRRESLVPMVYEIIENFNDASEAKGLIVETQVESDDICADVDREAFRKIVYNLLSNAVKYAGKCVHVTVSLDASKHMVNIDVENDGISIPKEDHGRVFEPFFRCKGTLRVHGTGLGLSISKHLAVLHNGDLVLSRSDETSTSFRLSLPLVQEGSYTTAPKDNGASESSTPPPPV